MIIIAMPLHVVLSSLLSLLVSRNNRNSDENFERLSSVLLLFLETNDDDDDSHTPRRNVFSTPPLTIVFSLAFSPCTAVERRNVFCVKPLVDQSAGAEEDKSY